MNITAVSNAPEPYSAPLISAEASEAAKRIRQALERAFQWLRSLFAFVVPIKQPPPLPQTDLILAARKVAALEEQKKPHPFRFLRNSIPQGMIPGLMSWYYGTHFAFSGFVSKKVIDASSSTLVYLSHPFFPSYSEALKKGMALTVCAPLVWNGANRLGYHQGWPFFLGIGMNIFSLGSQVYRQYKARALS